jgi:hypothetical protein
MQYLNAIFYIAFAFTSAFQQYPGFEWNKKSTLNADQRVEFPGIVLEPGVYIVRLKDGGERRSVIEILNRDETQVVATVIAVPDHQVRPDDNSEFTFHQVKSPGPRPVQTWFYAGDLVGLEFVYPKARAQEIAKASERHVLALNGTKDGPVVAITPNGKEVVVEDQPTLTARRKPE